MKLKKKAVKLLPPKNLRIVKVRTCAFCGHGSFDGLGSFVCDRPGGPAFDVGDGKFWYTTCDRYAVSI